MAAAPMLLNVVVIAAVYTGSRWAGLAGLQLLYVVSVSVVVAGLGQLGLQLAALRRADCAPLLNFRWASRPICVTLLQSTGCLLNVDKFYKSTLRT